MAAVFFVRHRLRRILRRERIFRDRTNPIDAFDDIELYQKFRFRREDILRITDEIQGAIEMPNRQGTLPSVMQVCLALRFYATGSFQDVCGELIGVHQSTACRVINRVTDALLPLAPNWIHLPQQVGADRTKEAVFAKFGIPRVFGFIDGTHVRIQSPGPDNQEEVYVNRKNYHSINVQVVCDLNMLFINLVARHPGSAHDSRVLRESLLFPAFEGPNRPLRCVVLLGDSGYMCRDWLQTPVLHPQNQREQNYNNQHSAARSTVERAIGLAKRRWHCLRRLRLTPDKACKIMTVCFMLSNRARRLALPDFNEEEEPDPAGQDEDIEEPDPAGQDEDIEEPDPAGQDEDIEDQPLPRVANPQAERARAEVGKRTRARIIDTYF